MENALLLFINDLAGAGKYSANAIPEYAAVKTSQSLTCEAGGNLPVGIYSKPLECRSIAEVAVVAFSGALGICYLLKKTPPIRISFQHQRMDNNEYEIRG